MNNISYLCNKDVEIHNMTAVAVYLILVVLRYT